MDPLAWIRTSTRRRRRGIHEKEKVDCDDVALVFAFFCNRYVLNTLRRSVNLKKIKRNLPPK